MIIAEEKAGEIQWEDRDRVAKGKGNLGKILAVEKAGKIPREGRRDRVAPR